MKKYEAVNRLRELSDQMYEALDEIKSIIKEIAPSEYERARSYWMAHIDGALENRGGHLGGSFISFEQTLEKIEDNVEDDNNEEEEEDV